MLLPYLLPQLNVQCYRSGDRAWLQALVKVLYVHNLILCNHKWMNPSWIKFVSNLPVSQVLCLSILLCRSCIGWVLLLLLRKSDDNAKLSRADFSHYPAFLCLLQPLCWMFCFLTVNLSVKTGCTSFQMVQFCSVQHAGKIETSTVYPWPGMSEQVVYCIAVPAQAFMCRAHLCLTCFHPGGNPAGSV